MGCGTSVELQVKPAEDFHTTYELGDKLGEGNFGQVRSCCHTASKQQFAVKILDVHRSSPEAPPEGRIGRKIRSLNAEAQELRRRAKHEAIVWQKVGVHAHCVCLYEVFMDESLCYLVMEPCERSVVKALEEMLPCPVEADILRIIYEILLALKHVHSCGVVHRDIKPDNFLLGGQSGMVTKLCDFGLSASVPASRQRHLSATVGTPPYMSPEMVSGHAYNTRTDIWSLGATAYVMLYGRFPYEPEVRTAANMKSEIARGCKPPQYQTIDHYPQPSKLAELVVRALLVRCPTKRESAERALNSRLGLELQDAAFSNNRTQLQMTGQDSLSSGVSFLPCVLAAELLMLDEVFTPKKVDLNVQSSIDKILSKYQRLSRHSRRLSLPDNYTSEYTSEHTSACEEASDDESFRSERSGAAHNLDSLGNTRSTRDSVTSGTSGFSERKSGRRASTGTAPVLKALDHLRSVSAHWTPVPSEVSDGDGTGTNSWLLRLPNRKTLPNFGGVLSGKKKSMTDNQAPQSIKAGCHPAGKGKDLLRIHPQPDMPTAPRHWVKSDSSPAQMLTSDTDVLAASVNSLCAGAFEDHLFLELGDSEPEPQLPSLLTGRGNALGPNIDDCSGAHH